MHAAARRLAVCGFLGAIAAAQSLRIDGAADTVRVERLAPGELLVSFEPGEAGRPAPLPLSVTTDSEVAVAVAPEEASGTVARHDFAAMPALVIRDDGARAGPSDWRVDAGVLRQASAIGGDREDPRRTGTRALLAANAPDVRVQVRLQPQGDGSLGIGLRQDAAGNGLRWHWDRAARRQRLEIVHGGDVRVLADAEAPGAIGDWYRFEAIVAQGAATVYVDDEPALVATLPALPPRGAVSLWTSGNAGSAFDDVWVRALSGGIDAAARPATFAGMNGWSDGIRSQWRFDAGVLAKTVEAGAAATARLAPGEGRDRLVRVQVRPTRRDGGVFGIAARWTADDQHYRLVLDPAARQVRLERQMGSHVEVLARQAIESAEAAWTGLALQVEGFRLQAFVNGRAMAQVFDGGHGAGRVGVFATADAGAEFARFLASAPVPLLASSALVRDGGRARLVARAPSAAGGVYALTLSLDRPHPLLPMPSGAELFVQQRLAAPVVLAGGRLGNGAFGDIGPRGEIEAELAWPSLLALHGQVVVVSAWLGSPDGELTIGALPAVALRF